VTPEVSLRDLRSGVSPQYAEHVLDELEQGHGVACFATRPHPGDDVVIYAAHRFSAESAAFSLHPSRRLRAMQAIAIQRKARLAAAECGHPPVVA
jgi:hypothetical protein